MDARPAFPRYDADAHEALPLAMRDIGFSVDGKTILDGGSLAVRPREVWCLLGPSGCGKTTLLRIAAGIERQTAGSGMVAGQTVADERTYVPAERRRLLPRWNPLLRPLFLRRARSLQTAPALALCAAPYSPSGLFSNGLPARCPPFSFWFRAPLPWHALSAGRKERPADGRAAKSRKARRDHVMRWRGISPCSARA